MTNLSGFAEACYDTNTIVELKNALAQRTADKIDCQEWKITPSQWRAAIVEALVEKIRDGK